MKTELFKGIVATNSVVALEERDIEDKAQQIFELAEDFAGFVEGLPKVYFKGSELREVKWNKFEEIKARFEAEISALNDENANLQRQIHALQQKRGDDIKKKEQKEHNVQNEQKELKRGFEVGDEVMVLHEVDVGTLDAATKTELKVGARGTVVEKIEESKAEDEFGNRVPIIGAIKIRFDFNDRAIVVQSADFKSLCLAGQVDSVSRNKVRELAHRGITLGALLDFYAGLGSKCFNNLKPETSMTVEVVKEAVIPITREKAASYTEYLQEGPKLATTQGW